MSPHARHPVAFPLNGQAALPIRLTMWHTLLRRLVSMLALALALALAGPAQAGRPCDEAPLSAESVERGLALALATEQRLQASGARVLLLARAGQDLRAYGLQWSHLGFAYRDGDAPDSPWRVLHKLNHCGTDQAALYRQGLGPFFLDRPWRHEAAFVALSAEAQERLLPLLRDTQRALQLHEPRYNVVAYPWATAYQQSNQWAIETLALALEPAVRNRVQAQAWLQLKGYRPTVLKLGPLSRLSARLTRANLAFDDHPNDKRFADRIETVTVDSVFDWLPETGLLQPGTAGHHVTRISL
jgi:hypothetical protein